MENTILIILKMLTNVWNLAAYSNGTKNDYRPKNLE